MVQDVALEIDLEETLKREPLTLNDCAEIRREVYRTESGRDDLLAMVDAKFPAGSKDPDVQFRRAVALACTGRFEEAKPQLQASKEPLASYMLGQAALDQDQVDEAKRLLAKVSGADHPIEFRVAYGEALARKEDYDALEKLVAEVQKAEPRSADALFLAGRLHEVQGSYAEALQNYERALAVQPDHRWARFRLAYRLDLIGRDNEAIAHYERLKQVFPVPVGVLLNLGILYEDQENYERAASCYRLVLHHDYNHPIARMFLTDSDASLEMFYDEDKERKDDKRAQILKIPVTDFELSVRSRNCLARMNIRSLGDLIRKSEHELLSFKNFGETSLNEIKEILRSKGLRLGAHADDDDRRDSRRRTSLDADAVRSKSVAELDLSVRSRKALDTLKIQTVGQLAEAGEEQLLACKNFGQTSLNEVKKKLADLGLGFKG